MKSQEKENKGGGGWGEGGRKKVGSLEFNFLNIKKSLTILFQEIAFFCPVYWINAFIIPFKYHF